MNLVQGKLYLNKKPEKKLPQPFTEEEIKKMGKSQDAGNVGLPNTEPSEKNPSSPPPTILNVDPPPR